MNDDEILQGYLLKCFNRSTGSYNNNKSILKHFLNTINKKISKITVFDIMEYFETSLDKKNIKKSTKNTIRYTLKSFFNYVKKQYLKEGKEYTNPVPERDLFEFSQKAEDIKRQSTYKLPILSMDELEQIKEYFEKNEKLFKKKKITRNYLLFLIAIFTGARISEVRTLRVNDINITERYLESGFIKDARKTTLRSEESLLFFFPEYLIEPLKEYLKIRKFNSEFLFYSPMNPTKPLSHELCQVICKKISKKLGFKFTWHYFRKTMITERIKMGCPEGLSEVLSNHVGTSVEWESYIKLSIEKRREKYDEFFPYNEIFKY